MKKTKWFGKTVIAEKHNTHDSDCFLWAGDFAGVNLKAVCEVCKNARKALEEG